MSQLPRSESVSSTMDASKMVMTMRGAVACEDSSVTWVLPHEHLIHNINANLGSDSDERERSVGSTIEDIRPDQLHELRVNPAASGINLVIDREDEIFREIELLESLTSSWDHHRRDDQERRARCRQTTASIQAGGDPHRCEHWL